MIDYIKKDDVLDIAIKARMPMDIREEEPDVAWVRGFNGALNSVYHLPAADVRPVEYGKWIFDDPLRGDFMCSNCLERQIVCSRYCPDCGADMRGTLEGFVPLDNALLEDADFSLADMLMEENK